MTKNKELAKNTFILFIGVFFTKIIQYLLLPLYTGYLSTSEYGTIDLFNTIVTLLIPIIGLQIEQGVFRFLIDNRKNNDNKKDIISSSFAFVIISIILSFILSIIILHFINNNYKWLVILNLYVTYFSSYLLQISRGLGDNKTYSIAGFIIAFITIISNILFLVGLGLKIDGMMYGTAIGYLFGILFVFIKIKLYLYLSIKNVKIDKIKSMLKYSISMIPNSLSWWVFSSSDRFIITAFLGVSATGLLSIAYKFSNIGIIIYNVFNLSLTESISLHLKDDDIVIYFNSINNRICNLFTSIGILLISFMPLIFTLLVNDSYNGGYNLIPIAIIATLFQVYSSNLGVIYIAEKNTKSVAVTSIVASIVNIVTDLLLVQYIGIFAAVVSTVISYLVLFIYRYVDICNKYFKLKYDNKFFVNLLIVFIIIVPIFYINNAILFVFSMIFAVIISFIFNKEYLIYLYDRFIKKSHN